VVHADPTPEDNSNPDGLNCVRGSATDAIAHLLWRQPGRLEEVVEAVRRLVHDQHLGVRTQAIAICSAIAQVDDRMAFELFSAICEHSDDRILKSHHAVDMLSTSWDLHPQAIRLIAERMIVSGDDEVASLGAELATYCSYRGGTLNDLARACLEGEPRLRAGAAKALGTVVLGDGPGAERAAHDLSRHFDAEEEAVRESAAEFFTREGALELEAAPRLVELVLESRARDLVRVELPHRLEYVNRRLKDFREILVKIAQSYLTDPGDRTFLAGAISLSKLLLTLYDESEDDRETRELCLDAWDALLESDASAVESALQRFD
jgi:hypothetical protein